MADGREPRVLPALEARILGAEARRGGAAHHLVGRLREMRGRTIALAGRAGPLARDVLLIVADHAEEAAVEFRAAEEPELAEAFVQAAEALRADARRFPAP